MSTTSDIKRKLNRSDSEFPSRSAGRISGLASLSALAESEAQSTEYAGGSFCCEIKTEVCKLQKQFPGEKGASYDRNQEVEV